MGFVGRQFGRLQPQYEVEAAASGKHALDLQFAAHELHQPRRDRQTQPGTTKFARDSAVGLRKWIEYFPLFLDRDAEAGIANLEQKKIGGAFRRTDIDGNRTVSGEFDGVADQIE